MTIPKTVEEWYELNQYEFRPPNRLEAYGIIWAAAVAAEREHWRAWVEEAVNYVGCETWSPSLKEEGEALLAAIRADTQDKS